MAHKEPSSDPSKNARVPSPPSVVIDSVAYIAPTWKEMGEYTFDLAQKIIDSGEVFDRIVTIAMGGWTWTRALMDFMQTDSIASLRVKSYTGVNSTGELKILSPLSDTVKGMNVLLFDDTVDSGGTVKQTVDYLISQGAKNVKVATLCYKPRSVVLPEYYAFQTEAWIVFPHEVREFITLSYNSWKGKGVSEKDMAARFTKIGLQREQIHYFMKLAAL